MSKELIALIIGLSAPLIVAITGLVTWALKAKKEALTIQENNARSFKIETYNTLLEPIIGVLTFSIPEVEQQNEAKKMLSIEYRKAAFNLITFGSDEVVRSYNKLMQAFITHDSPQEVDQREFGIAMIQLLTKLMLEIRKDLYSKNTKLKLSETVEFMFNDLDDYRDRLDNQV